MKRCENFVATNLQVVRLVWLQRSWWVDFLGREMLMNSASNRAIWRATDRDHHRSQTHVDWVSKAKKRASIRADRCPYFPYLVQWSPDDRPVEVTTGCAVENGTIITWRSPRSDKREWSIEKGSKPPFDRRQFESEVAAFDCNLFRYNGFLTKDTV